MEEVTDGINGDEYSVEVPEVPKPSKSLKPDKVVALEKAKEELARVQFKLLEDCRTAAEDAIGSLEL
jgi:hypothetical protein